MPQKNPSDQNPTVTVREFRVSQQSFCHESENVRRHWMVLETFISYAVFLYGVVR